MGDGGDDQVHPEKILISSLTINKYYNRILFKEHNILDLV